MLLAVAACSSGEGLEDDAAEDDAALTGDETLGTLEAGAILVTTANVNFRRSAEIADNVRKVIRKGTEVVAVGGEAENGFYAVTYGGERGYVSARYVTKKASRAPHRPSDGTRVTYIGDSHSDFEASGGAAGTLGFRVHEHLTAQGTEVALFAASSSAPNWWHDGTAEQAATWGYTQTVNAPARHTCTRGAKTGPCVPKLDAILEARASLFVIEQGSNMLGRTRADITNQIKTTLRQIEGKVDACLWVGAPRARAAQFTADMQEELWELISENASPTCFVYDSRFVPRTDAQGKMVLDANGQPRIDVPLEYSGSDGVHFDARTASKWADGVSMMIDWIRRRP